MGSPMYRVQEHFEEYNSNETVMMGLQGSQNYGLETEFSDVDTKMLVVPKFSDFVHNRKPISTTRVLDNDEHCDVKDVRLYWDCLRKQNINFVELLFTKYFVISPIYAKVWVDVRMHREKIARYDTHAAVKCIKGMALEKRKALDHPYPSKLEVLEEFGYDPKQLHHILRLHHFINNYTSDKPYSVCLDTPEKEYLKEVKTNGAGMSYNEAIEKADSTVATISDIADWYRACYENKKDEFVEELLEKSLEEILKIAFRRELRH